MTTIQPPSTIDISKSSSLSQVNLKNKRGAKQKEKDILHDTPLRYTGYCDDIGAATRVICHSSKSPFIKALPVLSYVPVAGYIAADVATTFSKSKKQGDNTKTAAKKSLSQLIFQGLTSIVFPIAIVAASQKVAGKALDKFVPSLKQNFLKDGSKIVNHKRNAALAVAGVVGLIAASKPVDKFTRKFIMKKAVDPMLKISRNDYCGNTGNERLCGNVSHSKLGTTQA